MARGLRRAELAGVVEGGGEVHARQAEQALIRRVGGVIACRWFEQALDGIEDLNAVYLRPVWFMENFLWNIGLIKAVGVNGLAGRRPNPKA